MLLDIETFGSIDAESDSNLLNYFYETPIAAKLLEYEKSIVIGRKGSGKTALYKYIQSKDKDKASALLFQHYPWKVHDRFKNSNTSERESYLNAWIFFFYIEIFKRLIKLESNFSSKIAKKTIRQIKKWIKNNWGDVDFDHKNVLSPSATRRISCIFSPQIFGNSLGSLAFDKRDDSALGDTLGAINSKFSRVLDTLLECYDGHISLLFDELDLSYSSNDREYKNRLIGLLLAAYGFFTNEKLVKKIRIYLFLRSDIFNILDFQDKNKIRDNMVVFLDWDADSTISDLSLKNLVSSRIKASVKSKTSEFNTNWNLIFDQAKIGKNQFKWNYITDRTFIRPRDYIKFINLALDVAKKRIKLNSGQHEHIINDDIFAVRETYSAYLYEELKDEVFEKYNDFPHYFEILREVHVMTFDFEKFKDALVKKNHLFSDRTVEPEVILARLYEFSVIGFYKSGGSSAGGAGYQYQYASDYQPFNPKAQLFRVHFGFKEYLNLVDSK
ncbi:MAG: hypothetical protein AB7E49_02055 [Campylobacterales bacterium]